MKYFLKYSDLACLLTGETYCYGSIDPEIYYSVNVGAHGMFVTGTMKPTSREQKEVTMPTDLPFPIC